MLIKITDFPDSLVDDLKHATGQATGSKAVFFAASKFVEMAEENTRLSFECAQLQERIDHLHDVLASARHACGHFLETINQRDLFTEEV